MPKISLANPATLTTEYSAEDVLSFLYRSGSIDVGDVESAMRQCETERVIKQAHKYSIFQDKKDGRYKTYVKDETKKSGRRLLAKSTLEQLNNALYEFYTQKSAEELEHLKTLADLFPAWIEMKELEGVTSTYLMKLNHHWKKYYLSSDIVTTPVILLNTKQLKTWALTTIEKFDLTRKEYTNMTVIMRGLLSDAIEEEIITSSPFSRVKIKAKKFRKVKKRPDLDQVFTEDEMRKIEEFAWEEIAAIKTLRESRQELIPLAVLFQFQTGIRVSELAAIRYEDVIPGNKGIMVQRMYRFPSQEIDEYTKGSYGDRIITLTNEAVRIIETAKKLQEENGLTSDGYIFSVTDRPPCYNVFYSKYMEYCERLETKKKATHSARRTFVSALISSGGNINTVRNACGHMDEQTTLHNYCYDMSTDKEKVELFEKALNWGA